MYWCFWAVVLEKTLESPLDCKEIQPVYPKGDQPWDLFGRNDAEAGTPVLWPPHGKSWLIGKDSDAGRDWGQEEKGTTEDEMAGWHHRLNGCESEWTPGVADGQGGLVCCDSWGRKESDTTERLIWSDLIWCVELGRAVFSRSAVLNSFFPNKPLSPSLHCLLPLTWPSLPPIFIFCPTTLTNSTIIVKQCCSAAFLNGQF